MVPSLEHWCGHLLACEPREVTAAIQVFTNGDKVTQKPPSQVTVKILRLDKWKYPFGTWHIGATY
jgi:hypothetical protein